ncbi:hypothetical protein [Streptomyces palmae]|uniref:Hsp70 family protein n=1 Tax=Streptomyces palmae TaxID=1701085 RepID=A0A4Z0HF88_9ACTN|nr:hypothetical protein [Streptomyces palmae]TGB17700.1 hypothetical protein E4099_03130 [Streptomyces palmae]
MTAPTAIAIDAGARFTRIAHLGEDGTPVPAELPGSVPGEGLPTPVGTGGHRGAALRDAYAAYREHRGTPERVVLVVPQQDRADHARRAVDVLTALHGTDPMPRLRVLGAPHAVMALLRHTATATAPRYTVCDLGAGAVEVSLCAFTAGSVAVTGSARYGPAGGYGAASDAALLDGAGLPDDDAGRRALDQARARQGAAQRLDVALRRTARHPGRYEDTVVLQVAGRDITAGMVRRALDRLAAGLDRALAEARGGRPAPPVVAVGGGARFGPLLRHLADRQGEPVALPGGVDPAHAAVFGAALVAAGRVDPADRYPYAVSVGTHRTAAGRPRAEELLISPAGALEPGGATVFAESGGRRVLVRTGPAGARPVRIQVRDAESGAVTSAGTLTIPPGAEGARFHVGVRIAADGTARLVLHPLGSGTPSEHPLGALPTDIEGARS